jgi:hypothetical protein
MFSVLMLLMHPKAPKSSAKRCSAALCALLHTLFQIEQIIKHQQIYALDQFHRQKSSISFKLPTLLSTSKVLTLGVLS